MKTEQKRQAKTLYLTAQYTNIQIADMVGVDRRTIMLWARRHHWQQQRDAEQAMPAMLAERAALLAHRFTSQLLRDPQQKVELKHARSLYYIASGISRLRHAQDEARTELLRSFTHRLAGVKH